MMLREERKNGNAEADISQRRVYAVRPCGSASQRSCVADPGQRKNTSGAQLLLIRSVNFPTCHAKCDHFFTDGFLSGPGTALARSKGPSPANDIQFGVLLLL